MGVELTLSIPTGTRHYMYKSFTLTLFELFIVRLAKFQTFLNVRYKSMSDTNTKHARMSTENELHPQFP